MGFSPGSFIEKIDMHGSAKNRKTPFLVISKRVIRESWSEFQKGFGKGKVFYALKANPDRRIVNLLHELGSGFEISSLSELNILLNMGVPPEMIISSNTVKESSFIDKAGKCGVMHFAFDSTDEVEKLARFAPGSKVSIRLDVPNEGSEWPLGKKFGVGLEEALGLLLYARERGLSPHGVVFHVGSQCVNIDNWRVALEKSRVLWGLAEEKGLKLKLLNVGGGFPVRYTKDIPSIPDICRLVHETISRLFPADVEIFAEPGRALVGEAGVLAASVIGKALRDGERWLYLDVGVFHGLVEAMGGISYPFTSEKDGVLGLWTVAGPSCDGYDVIRKDVELPELEDGNRVYIMSAGAYTTAYASRFNGFAIPRTYMLED
ncbi:MAG: type III PLP-dependent enzyme [Chloroflexi bacterium]|nr:type III PLP-dependent enzyme [Chloroflexota bacterium]